MNTPSYERLQAQLEPGRVYRRDVLLAFSKAIDRDLSTLTKKGVLEKVGQGFITDLLFAVLGHCHLKTRI